jgi:hypothetical protein
MDILFPFSESKLKPNLKMASKRIQIANSKRSAHSAHGKREVRRERERERVSERESMEYQESLLPVLSLFSYPFRLQS